MRRIIEQIRDHVERDETMGEYYDFMWIDHCSECVSLWEMNPYGLSIIWNVPE